MRLNTLLATDGVVSNEPQKAYEGCLWKFFLKERRKQFILKLWINSFTASPFVNSLGEEVLRWLRTPKVS